MNKLTQELQRLYLLPDQRYRSQDGDDAGPLTSAQLSKSLQGETSLAVRLLDENNATRAMVIAFEQAGDWSHLASLYQHLQDDLGLPAMAVSVSAQGGFQLWLSLREPISLAQAHAFLEGIRHRYPNDLPPARTRLLPTASEAYAGLAPGYHEAAGRWSAFIDPTLVSIFADSSGLEMAPSMEGQADILNSFECIKSEDFQRALELLRPPIESNAPTSANSSPAPNVADINHDYRDPRSFLLAVMNLSTATLEQRIQAASALLPYFESHKS